MRVMIVEDEPLIALSLKQEIVEAGHLVVGPAASTGEAYLLAQREKPELALVDLDLRNTQDGAELAQSLKKLAVPAVFLSSEPQRAMEHADAALGVMIKPFNFDDVSPLLNVAEKIIAGEKLEADDVPPTLRLFH